MLMYSTKRETINAQCYMQNKWENVGVFLPALVDSNFQCYSCLYLFLLQEFTASFALFQNTGKFITSQVSFYLIFKLGIYSGPDPVRKTVLGLFLSFSAIRTH